MPLVFEGLRVIDCGSFVAAPAAAALLGDLGANVIKIESPGDGDPLRRMHLHPDLPKGEHGYGWMLDGRNKRSIVLDLKRAEGLDILYKLVRQSDVFVTNFPPGVRERLKIEESRLRSVNPRLIYAAFSGYGETGDERDRPGFDSTSYWARSGLMDQTAMPDAPPPRTAPAMGDHTAALALFGAIAAALYRRERTGEGGRAATSLLATGFWVNATSIQAALTGARPATRVARTDVPNAGFNTYRCRDGRWFVLTLANGEAKGWPAVAAAIGRPDLLDNPRFSDPRLRAANAAALVRELDAAFATRDWADWEPIFRAHRVTVGVVQRAADTALDPQALETGLLPMIECGTMQTVANPFDFGGPSARYRAAPELGADADAILDEIGIDPDERARLRAASILGTA